LSNCLFGESPAAGEQQTDASYKGAIDGNAMYEKAFSGVYNKIKTINLEKK
jgi:hypothetical protein